MYTTNELQMLRNAIGGARIPGIDTPTGNRLPASSLVRATTLSDGPGYVYQPKYNRVVVYQNGANLSGIDFGSVTLDIAANNVTVTNCTFEPTNVWFSVIQYGSGATIQNCTFTGAKYSTPVVAFVGSKNFITLKNNTFVDAPEDAVDIQNGVISGNYFSGGGYMTGAHADAIWISGTTSSVSITNNFIDWTRQCRRCRRDQQRHSYHRRKRQCEEHYSLRQLFAWRRLYNLAGNNTTGTLTNVSITGNYVGFGQYGAYYPTTASAAKVSGNTVFDWTNPQFSTSAWSAYLHSGLTTPNLIVSSGSTIASSSSKPTTLYGAGHKSSIFSARASAKRIMSGGTAASTSTWGWAPTS